MCLSSFPKEAEQASHSWRSQLCSRADVSDVPAATNRRMRVIKGKPPAQLPVGRLGHCGKFLTQVSSRISSLATVVNRNFSLALTFKMGFFGTSVHKPGDYTPLPF